MYVCKDGKVDQYGTFLGGAGCICALSRILCLLMLLVIMMIIKSTIVKTY